LAEERPKGLPEDPRRLRSAMRQRYIGTAIIGFAIILYWCGKIFVAWWGG
jgi:hypothetical protein